MVKCQTTKIVIYLYILTENTRDIHYYRKKRVISNTQRYHKALLTMHILYVILKPNGNACLL